MSMTGVSSDVRLSNCQSKRRAVESSCRFEDGAISFTQLCLCGSEDPMPVKIKDHKHGVNVYVSCSGRHLSTTGQWRTLMGLWAMASPWLI